MRRLIIALALAATLSACASAPKAAQGNYAVGSEYSVNLGRLWSDITPVMLPKVKPVHVLSVDGPLLNRLYITEGIAPGEYMIKPANKETPTPTYRTGLSPGELAEFVTDTIAAYGYQAPEFTNLRPAKFGAADGLRFEVTARTKEGLNISGTSQVAERNGKLYVMLYLAPSEHYYGAHLPEVERTFASASLQ